MRICYLRRAEGMPVVFLSILRLPFLRPLVIFILCLSGLLMPAGPAAAQQEGAACGGPPGPVRIHIIVERIRSATGLIAVTVYGDNQRKFLAKRGSLYVVRVPAAAPTTRLCVQLPSTGFYGFAVYHDAD